MFQHLTALVRDIINKFCTMGKPHLCFGGRSRCAEICKARGAVEGGWSVLPAPGTCCCCLFTQLIQPGAMGLLPPDFYGWAVRDYSNCDKDLVGEQGAILLPLLSQCSGEMSLSLFPYLCCWYCLIRPQLKKTCKSLHLQQNS